MPVLSSVCLRYSLAKLILLGDVQVIQIDSIQDAFLHDLPQYFLFKFGMVSQIRTAEHGPETSLMIHLPRSCLFIYGSLALLCTCSHLPFPCSVPYTSFISLAPNTHLPQAQFSCLFYHPPILGILRCIFLPPDLWQNILSCCILLANILLLLGRSCPPRIGLYVHFQ